MNRTAQVEKLTNSDVVAEGPNMQGDKLLSRISPLLLFRPNFSLGHSYKVAGRIVQLQCSLVCVSEQRKELLVKIGQC